MTLRTRLLIVLVGIVLVGLLVSGIVTYKSLESFLVSRLDQQLVNSPAQASHALQECIRQDTPQCTTTEVPAVPSGTFGQLRVQGGQTYSAWFLLTSSSQPPQPNLPANVTVSTPQDPTIFDAVSSSGLTYRVFAVAVEVGGDSPFGGDPAVVVVAVPLTAVDQTLGPAASDRAARVRGRARRARSGRVVDRPGRAPPVSTRWPTTAGAIAAGDLTQRVPTGDTGTEVGRLGQALNVMLGEIEESFAARKASEERLRRFLADASHELRTPLTSIRGYAEMFDRGARDRPEDLATSMRHIRADADRMSTLVDDLLVLARLDRERPLAHERVDLRQLLEPAVSDISVHEPQREVRLSGEETAVVAGDANRLRQVFDNLLVNAVRHTPAGTPVEVDLRGDGDSAVISVTDHGPGIPAVEREQDLRAVLPVRPFALEGDGRRRARSGDRRDHREGSRWPGRGGRSGRRGSEVLGPASCGLVGSGATTIRCRAARAPKRTSGCAQRHRTRSPDPGFFLWCHARFAGRDGAGRIPREDRESGKPG